MRPFQHHVLVSLRKKGKCIRDIFECGIACCRNCGYLSGNVCTIYQNRPEHCKVFPHNPMALERGCGYYFIEDGIVITPDSYKIFSDSKKREWLYEFIERSEDVFEDKSHTTDAYLRFIQNKTHTTDSGLKATTDKSHTTDAYLVKTQSKTHTTDSRIKK